MNEGYPPRLAGMWAKAPYALKFLGAMWCMMAMFQALMGNPKAARLGAMGAVTLCAGFACDRFRHPR